MMTVEGTWGITILLGAGILLFLSLSFWLITRSVVRSGTWVRCPVTGHVTVVQHITADDGYLTDLVSCSAFPHRQPVTCALPCLTGDIRTRVSSSSDDRVRV
jgi:hypothetical protein